MKFKKRLRCDEAARVRWVDFTRVGKLALEEWRNEEAMGAYYPQVSRCDLCRALVLEGDTGMHTDFHWGDRA